MTSLECDMDIDSGVSDLTCSESAVSDRTASTIIASPPASIAANDADFCSISEAGSHQFHNNTMLDGQSVRGSMFNSDSGIASGSGGRQQLPRERLDSARRTQEWVDTRSSDKANMLNLENDLHSDSGVSDMTGSGSNASNRAEKTTPGFSTWNMPAKGETTLNHNGLGRVIFPNTILREQSTRDSMISADSGIASISLSGSVKSRDSAISSGSVSGSVKSNDSGIKSGSVSGSVKSNDSGIKSGSVSGSVKSNDSGIKSGSVSGSVKSNDSGIKSGSVSGSFKFNDSGISSGSVSGSVKSNDSGIKSGSVSSSVKSIDSGISSGSVSGSVKSNDSGISSGSVSGSVKSNDSGILSGSVSSSLISGDSGISSGSTSNTQLPKKRLDSATRTLNWVKTSQFEVNVKTLDGKTIRIKVEKDEEVLSFRKKVEEMTTIPGSQQYLVSAGGRKLIDGERLSAYNIEKDSTIYSQGRLRGG